MRSVEEHQRAVADLIRARPAVTVPLTEAEGLVLAKGVTAPVSLPIFDNSAMDGYAVLADDVVATTSNRPVKLAVIEDIPAGRTDIPALVAGTAHRITTGAPMPVGADAVVPVEATDGGTDTVAIRAAVPAGRHVRRGGGDVAAGEMVLRAGQVVGPAMVGLSAALGLTRLPVRPRLRVLVISTGTELMPPGTPLEPGQIYESNGMMLAATVREAGAMVVAVATVSDDAAQFSAVIDWYGAEADLIITSGGISAGAYEVVKDVFGRSGDQGVEFVKVAMQPGMPQGIGRVGDAAIIALPGSPVGALVSFEVFIRSALRTAMGLPTPARPRRSAVLAETLTSPHGKRQFRHCMFDPETGTVTGYGPSRSRQLRYLVSTNCLLEIAEHVTDLPIGARLQVWDLTG